MVLALQPESYKDPADLEGQQLCQELVTFIRSFADIKGEMLDVELVTHSFDIKAMEISYANDGLSNFLSDENGGTDSILEGLGSLVLTGDLQGALEDLTVVDPQNYECLEHRAYVKHLLKDEKGARLDAQGCLAMGRQQPGDSCLGVSAVSFLEFDL
ncbi:unnamed protein product [Calypogeia fissa]